MWLLCIHVWFCIEVEEESEGDKEEKKDKNYRNYAK